MSNIEVVFSIPPEQLAQFERILNRFSVLIGQPINNPDTAFDHSIFISYRRKDSAYITGRIYDRLIQAFGKGSVFRDIDNILSGRNFTQELERQLAACDLMLVIIGPDWLDMRDEETGIRRLDDDGDIVRLEIQTGLERDIPIIPLLIRDAAMPKAASLPLRLKPLADKAGEPIQPDPRFHTDIDRLIEKILQTIDSRDPQA